MRRAIVVERTLVGAKGIGCTSLLPAPLARGCRRAFACDDPGPTHDESSTAIGKGPRFNDLKKQYNYMQVYVECGTNLTTELAWHFRDHPAWEAA